MGKGSFEATADDGDDAIKVGVGHGSPGRQAKAAVERKMGQSFLSPDKDICSLAAMPLPLMEHIHFDQSRCLAFLRPRF